MYIIIGIIVCLIALIICAMVLKFETDRIIDDYESTNHELRKRLRKWAEYSYSQSDKIKQLEEQLKAKERV